MRASTIVLYNSNGAKSGDMSGNLIFGTLNAFNIFQPLDLEQIFGYSIQANYSGVPAGSLKLEASNDNVNWTDIPGTAFTVAGPGSFLWNVSSSNYLYVRLVWTASGGSTGTLTGLAFVRGI